MLAINNSNSEITDHIYTFLVDTTARKAFGLSCRQFRLVFLENEKYLALATFVSENYTICASNLNGLPLWRQLKLAHIILVGESHHITRHRKIFAELTHRLWKKDDWALLTEGKHDLSTGQVKYLNKEIAEVSDSWDIIDHKIFEKTKQLITMSILLTRAFLILCDEDDPNKGIELIENQLCFFKNAPLDSYIEENLHRMKTFLSLYEAFQQFPDNEGNQILLFRNIQSYSHERTLILVIIGRYIRNLIYRYQRELLNLINGSLLQRDQEMVINIEWKRELGKKVLVIAGNGHVKQSPNSPSAILQQKKHPFVSLIPKEVPEKGDNTDKTQVTLNSREKLKNFDPNVRHSSEELHEHQALNLDNILEDEIVKCIKEDREITALVYNTHGFNTVIL